MILLDTGMKWNIGFWTGVTQKHYTEVSKVKFLNILEIKKTKTNGIPIVITYHPLLKDFAKVINKHLRLLHINDKVKKAFTAGLMVWFRGIQKLSSYLVRAKLYTLERSVGSFKFNGKRCQVCMNVTEVLPFLAQLKRKSMLLIIVLTARTNVLYIYSLVISANAICKQDCRCLSSLME